MRFKIDNIWLLNVSFTILTTLTSYNVCVIFPLVTANRFHQLPTYSLKHRSYNTVERSKNTKQHSREVARSTMGECFCRRKNEFVRFGCTNRAENKDTFPPARFPLFHHRVALAHEIGDLIFARISSHSRLRESLDAFNRRTQANTVAHVSSVFGNREWSFRFDAKPHLLPWNRRSLESFYSN